MADDISKKITIGVEAQTDKFTQSVSELTKQIDALLAKQQQLNTAGQQNSAAFEGVAAKLYALKKQLQEVTTQVKSSSKALTQLSTSAKKTDEAVSSLAAKHQKHAKAASDSSAKLKELGGQVNALGQSVNQQKASVDQGKNSLKEYAGSAAKGAKSAKDLQGNLSKATPQVKSNTDALTKLSASTKNTDGAVSSLTSKHQKHTKAAGDSSSKLKELGSQVNAVGQSVNQQKNYIDQGKSSLDEYAGNLEKGAKNAKSLRDSTGEAGKALNEQANAVNENKTAFDTHAVVMEHLKKTFDDVKDVSGIFGPSLKEAADGFSLMKSGLSLVKDGLNGVGEAIKADGFGFLLEILQKIFDYFTKTTEGSKMLGGAISAIGVIVNKVESFFHLFMDTIIKAFSHPIDTLKSLGKMIEQNIINRFKAFSVILDGIIHLDFKKMANGAIQAFTGVTDATDKIGHAFTAVKNGVTETTKQMVSAYQQGYANAGTEVDKHEKKVKDSIGRQIGYHQNLQNQISSECGCEDKANDSSRADDGQLTASHGDSTKNPEKPPVFNDLAGDNNGNTTSNTKNVTDQEVKIKKTAIQQVEDFAKQSASKVAADALNTLTNSIKQQSEAKIAGLEKDKAAELNNASLTSGQKLAIEQKYRKEEGQIKAKAFKEEQDLSIAQALINGAVAVTKVSAQDGALAALEIGVIIAETAAQVAKIASQKPPAYASGGLHYMSDGRGGLLPGYSKTDNTNAYLRSGEGVVVSEAMRVPWARNLVSAINVGFGGRDFSMANPGRGYAIGGIFTDGGDANRYYNQPVHDQKNLANTIAYQMINNFPPVYVDVKDINNQQNILAQTINRVNL